ncbi:MAG: hypothetical protein Q8S33_00860 [Myxococcales bacterium]|nr:hypothetical protein [Myxococcales bacterium]MDP3498842.1 hypothetical protein [Myxococcales bacterium]
MILTRLCLLLLLAGALTARAQSADAGVTLSAASAPVSPVFSPLAVPFSLLAPGSGQLLRGETRAGGTMLAWSSVLLGAAFGGAFFMAGTGASDVSTAVGPPLGIIGLGGFLSLGIADAVGTFSDGQLVVPAETGWDGWNATWRGGISTLVAPRAGQPGSVGVTAFGAWRTERFLVTAELANVAGTLDGWGQAGGGVKLVGYSSEVPRAGLWLESSLRHELAARVGFDGTRWRTQLVSVLPMGVFAPRFGRVTSILRLGLDPTWVRYRERGMTGFELPLSGGFEVRTGLTDWLRGHVGYEHARDGLVGGSSIGFLGSFHAGMEVALPGDLVWDVRVVTGTPLAFFTSLEWRAR